MNKIGEIVNQLHKARTYLEQTDYIVIKLSEALANGEDITELKTLYAEQLAKRKEYRASIDTLQLELNALNEELKASEEVKNDETSEEVIEETPSIEQPIEETPTDNIEVVEETPTDENTTSEDVETTPSEQPIEDTTETSEVVEDTTSEVIEETPSEEVIEQPIEETEEVEQGV